MKVTNNTKLIITTSRKPSQITRRFAQFLKHYFNSEYINRGKLSLNKLTVKTKQSNADKLIIINETKGNPSSINVYNITEDIENTVVQLYITVMLPKENQKTNVNHTDIKIFNKIKKLNPVLKLFNYTQASPKESLNNTIYITENEDKDSLSIDFYDKNANKLDTKIYLKGFDL